MIKNDIHLPAIKGVTLDDPLLGGYAALVAQKMLPYQWGTLNDRIPGAEKSYCIHNFRVAAGDEQGAHQGAVFVDTDAYKWLEAVAYCIENGTGGEFRAQADALIDLISRAQQEDGYLQTYYIINHPERRWTNLVVGHELYCAGHLIEAAVAYYYATNTTKLLDVAQRFVRLIASVFGNEEGKFKGYPGHPEIELALVKLYRATQKREYLELAGYFVYQRGQSPNYLMEEIARRPYPRMIPEFCDFDAAYAQSQTPVKQQEKAEGHAVRAMYLYTAAADVAKELGDEALANACVRLWQNVTQKRMYITGGIGSSGYLERFTADYDLPNDRMYCETCASVGLMRFGRRMAELTGEAGYYDTVERALCNTVLGGMAISGERYFYVNPLEVWPDNCLNGTSMAHVKPVRQKWFSVACCPPNIARTLASLGQYIYAEGGDCLYINMPISSSIKTAVCGGMSVKMEAALMHGGDVKLTVAPDSGRPYKLRVRLPAYLKKPALHEGEKPLELNIDKGWAVIEAKGAKTFTITGSVTPEFVAADINVRADAGKAAVAMGPFVYCLEEMDNGKNLPALFIDTKAPIETLPPDPALPGGLPLLAFDGWRLTRSAGSGELYGAPEFEKTPVRLKAAPYCQWGNRTPGEMLVWLKAII